MRPLKFKIGERVVLAGTQDQYEGEHGTIAGVLTRGRDCDLYLVDCDCGVVAELCDHCLDTAKPLPADFNITVPWSAVAWRPRPENLPAVISGVLRRVRGLRLGRWDG